MQDAIESGRGEPVDALLRGMSEQHQKAQLRASYGGSPDIPGDRDKNDLFIWTTPMLHAARCGNTEAFCSLLNFTKKLLRTEVGKTLLYTILVSTAHLTTILLVTLLILCKNKNISSSSCSPSTDSYLISTFASFPKPQLKTIIKARDQSGRTILALAALSGRRETVNIVLDGIGKELDPTEVRHLPSIQQLTTISMHATSFTTNPARSLTMPSNEEDALQPDSV